MHISLKVVNERKTNLKPGNGWKRRKRTKSIMMWFFSIGLRFATQSQSLQILGNFEKNFKWVQAYWLSNCKIICQNCWPGFLLGAKLTYSLFKKIFVFSSYANANRFCQSSANGPGRGGEVGGDLLSNKADPPSRQLLLLLIFSDLNQDNVLNKTYSYVIFLWPTAPYLTHLNMQREAFNITWSVKMLVMWLKKLKMFFTQEVVVAPRCLLVALGRREWTRLSIWGYMQGRFNMKYMANMIYR